MKLAVSNIAWAAEADEQVADLMVELGFEGLEVAPTRVWAEPLAVDKREVAAFRSKWERKGIRVVAMQALLFGRPDLTVFQSDAKRAETEAYLRGMIRLGSLLGAGPLIFGSPRNRSVAGSDAATVAAIAQSFFRSLGDYAAKYKTCLCIEPNPPEYGCDYVTDLASAEALVDVVGSPGFGLHIDTGGMYLSRESLEETIGRVAPSARHFHISEPHLVPVGTGGVDHPRIAAALASAGYDRWMSVEMRAPDELGTLTRLKASLAYASACYAEVAAA